MTYPLSVILRMARLPSLCALLLWASHSVFAADQAKKAFDLPADVASRSLKSFALQSGVEVLISADLGREVRTQAVKGTMTPREAMTTMLQDTGLAAEHDERTGAYAVRKETQTEKNGASRRASDSAAPIPRKSQTDDEVVALSPFVTSDKQDKGYYSEQTLLGSRSAQKLLDIPSNISIINKEMLEDLSATNVQQVLNYGTSGAKQSQGFNDDFVFRGFRTLGAMRDGITNPSNKSNELYDVERVEVLKGPAAMLFGENNLLGGGVNLVTRKPTEKFHGQIDSEVSNKNYLRLTANVSGPIHHFKSEDIKILYRATLGGWKDDRFKEIQRRDETFMGGGISFLFGQKTSITVDGHNFNDQSYMYFDDVSDHLLPNGRDVPEPGVGFGWSIARSKDVFWTLRARFYRAQVLHSFTENASIRVVYALFDKEDRRRLIRQRGFVSQYIMARDDLPLELDNVVRTTQIDYLHKLQIGPTRHDIAVGVQTDVTDGFQRLSVLKELPDIDIRNPDFSNDILTSNPAFTSNTESIVRQYHYHVQENMKVFDDRLILVGGLRWIERKSESLNRITNIRTDLDPPQVMVHKWGLVYKVLPVVSVYATEAANVFVNTAGPLNPATKYETPRKDQEGKLKEIGVKWQALQGHLYGSAAYFDMAMTNVVTGGPAPDGALNIDGRPLQINIQTAQQRSKGYEAEVGYRQELMGWGHADVMATYYQADSRTQTNTPFLNHAPYIYSFLGKVSLTRGVFKGLTVGGGMRKQGSFLELAGAVANAWPVTGTAFASYTFHDRWVAHLNVDNITNARYIITGTSLAEGNDPRRFRFGVSYKW